MYKVPIGKAATRREGKDVTIIAISHMVIEAYNAAEELLKEGIDVEIIDLRTLRPLDEDLILRSVTKTNRVVIADTGWRTNGVAAEIAALISEKAFFSLNSPKSREDMFPPRIVDNKDRAFLSSLLRLKPGALTPRLI